MSDWFHSTWMNFQYDMMFAILFNGGGLGKLSFMMYIAKHID